MLRPVPKRFVAEPPYTARQTQERAMSNALSIATAARLIGDPARANMLTALMGGMALTASELAREAGVGASTASGHLARLVDGGMVLCVQQGRHRYFRLAGPDVADVLETLMQVAVRGAPRRRIGPREASLRHARVCYDHLAGWQGVRLSGGLAAAGRLAFVDHAYQVTEEGRRFFCDFGIDMAAIDGRRRPMCRTCLDWSERKPHLGGGLGAALLTRMFDLGWMRRTPGSRALETTAAGMAGLRTMSPGEWSAEAVVRLQPPSAACR
jgi:DNA-binding transcriptional ArsR family regulator